MRKFIKQHLLLIIVLFLFSFMNIGYALYGETLNLNGNINITKPGTIEITSATIVTSESSGLSSYETPEYEGMKINFTLTGSSRNFYATYLIVITNNSFYDYAFTDFAFNPFIEGSDNTAKITTTVTNYDTGATVGPGDMFLKGSITTLKVKIELETENSGTTVNITGNASMSEDNTGSITTSITPIEGNLQGDNTMACFTLNVINTYSYTRIFSLTSSNENIHLVDNTGTDLSNFTITANTTSDYEICTTIKEGSIFLTESTTTTIILSSNGISNINVATLNLAVDPDINATDKDIPQVGSVSLSINETEPVEGEATLNWSRIDSGGSSISNYHIILYNETTGTSTTYSTGNDVTSYAFTSLTEGTYYAKVYGEDEAGNIGVSSDVNYCDSATIEDGYCSKSESVSLKWTYSITYSLTNLDYSGTTSALIYSQYETTLSLSSSVQDSNYSLPTSVTVTMNDVELTNGTEYSYSSSTGLIVINKITGDVTITGSATWFCLIEGTKIRLADGSYKNIEDINYNDLLAVYNHELGGITYEYPIWIEHEVKVNYYQKTTFSDGTELKTFGPHGVFSMDVLKYVSVTDKDLFDIGSKVAKINEDGTIKIVTVTNIETIYEETSYYHVSSTRYHNIIAEDILTTDGSIITSNMFSYDENIVWTSEREEFLKTNDLFHYEDWKNFFPEHIFKGYRMEEAKHIFNQGLLDIEMYYQNLKDLGTDTIKDNEGNNLWMVTTSDNLIINKEDYLMKQNSYYTLPIPQITENFIGWYNTADGKIYQPDDTIRIIYGMHFIAKYETSQSEEIQPPIEEEMTLIENTQTSEDDITNKNIIEDAQLNETELPSESISATADNLQNNTVQNDTLHKEEITEINMQPNEEDIITKEIENNS